MLRGILKEEHKKKLLNKIIDKRGDPAARRAVVLQKIEEQVKGNEEYVVMLQEAINIFIRGAGYPIDITEFRNFEEKCFSKNKMTVDDVKKMGHNKIENSIKQLRIVRKDNEVAFDKI